MAEGSSSFQILAHHQLYFTLLMISRLQSNNTVLKNKITLSVCVFGVTQVKDNYWQHFSAHSSGRASLVAKLVKNPSATQETWV